MAVNSSEENNKAICNDGTPSLVLSCIDGSHYTGAVCDYSAWLAANLHAPLKLLHISNAVMFR